MNEFITQSNEKIIIEERKRNSKVKSKEIIKKK